MLTCKQVSKTLRDKRLEDLNLFQRVSLRFHVGLCLVCGKFHRNVMTMKEGTRQFSEMEEELNSSCCLADEFKNQLKRQISEAKQADSSKAG